MSIFHHKHEVAARGLKPTIIGNISMFGRVAKIVLDKMEEEK